MSIEVFPGTKPLTRPAPPNWGEISPDGDPARVVRFALVGGWADETLSSAAYRMETERKLAGRIFRPLIDLIFRPFGAHHCRNAYLAEHRRHQLPPSLRG